jgi:hypothetical protein
MEFSYGDSLQLQHWNLTALSIQDSPIHSERSMAHKQPQDPWRSTNEHSAQWNKKVKYQILEKIRKPYTNALAVNLPENS